MLFTPKNIKKFQQGGAVPPADSAAPEEMPAEGGQDPILMLGEAAAQALQALDCQMAMQVCQGLISLVQQAGGLVAPEPLGEPVFKKGGILLRRIKK